MLESEEMKTSNVSVSCHRNRHSRVTSDSREVFFFVDAFRLLFFTVQEYEIEQSATWQKVSRAELNGEKSEKKKKRCKNSV